MKILNIEISKYEIENVVKNMFSSTNPLILKNYSRKLKKKVAILYTIAKSFEKNKKYTEKEVNEIIKPIYSDYVTIRRDLYDASFLDRTNDGSEYWVNEIIKR